MELGRPKKTVEETFKDWQGWKDEILTLYKKGASDVEVKCLISEHCDSISDDLWYRWMEEEPEFSGTIKRGKLLSQVWWEKKGRKNLENKDFSFTGWYMNMKNRFNWKDKTDFTSGDEPVKTVSVTFENYKDEQK